MLPFPILNNYGNIIPVYEFSGTFTLQSTSSGPTRKWSKSTSDGQYIYVYGGLSTTSGGYSNALYRYNPSTGQFNSLAAGPSIATYGMGFYHYNGDIYLYGGTNSAGAVNQRLSKYNISTNTWTTINSTNLPGNKGYCDFTSNGDTFYFGGEGNTFYSYTVSTNSWVKLSNSPANMLNTADNCANIKYLNSTVYTLNGSGLLQRYDTVQNIWLSSVQTTAGLIVVANNKLYKLNTTDLSVFDPSTSTFVVLNSNLSIKYSAQSLVSNNINSKEIYQFFGGSGGAVSANVYKIT